MTNFNIEQALKYLKQGDLNLVQHYLELEKLEQDTYFPVTRFCLGDLDKDIYDSSKLDEFAAADVANCLGEAYLENGYWTDLKIIMAERHPEAFIKETE